MIFSLIILAALFYTLPSYANPACPVCTVGVAVGLEIARNMGVDDGVIGVWAGALLMLVGYWTILWCDKKNWNFKFRNQILIALSLSMIAGIYVKELTYTPKPILIFYLDPFLFCTLLGAAVLAYSSVLYQWMKAKNGGHAHFPFEKVVLPIAALALTGYAVDVLQICQPATETAVVGENTQPALPDDGSDIYDFNK
ncbi:MAG: hypothetical protein Q4D80_04440 [Pseudomonadota bacterium]|nr:hypothetical protein [Pseudomonadota bacterium]